MNLVTVQEGSILRPPAMRIVGDKSFGAVTEKVMLWTESPHPEDLMERAVMAAMEVLYGGTAAMKGGTDE